MSASALAFAQDVGADVGGGAGIFRAKNPETKKSATKPAAGTKPTGRTTGTTRATSSNVAERVEDLLDKGNEARDARKFAEAEDSYKEVLKLKPRDARAAYGLGNVYSDQQRWDDAEAAYRNSVAWAPNECRRSRGVECCAGATARGRRQRETVCGCGNRLRDVQSNSIRRTPWVGIVSALLCKREGLQTVKPNIPIAARSNWIRSLRLRMHTWRVCSIAMGKRR